jgi:hypothetical protein
MSMSMEISSRRARAFCRARAFWLTAGLAVFLGCGGSGSGTSDGGAGHGGAGTSGSAGTAGAAGQSGGGAGGQSACGPRGTYGGGETSQAGASVTANIVDETGAPVVGQPVYIGGLDITSDPSTTDGAGHVAIQTNLSMKRPAFKVGDAVAYTELAIPLTAPTTDLSAGGQLLAVGKLSNKTGAALTPGTPATSGDVTVTVPAGGSVGIDALVYDTPDSQKLRTVGLPLANSGPVLASAPAGVGAGFALLYGLAPSETIFCPAAKVTVTLPHATGATGNDLGWAAGTAVEFWITTLDVAQTYAPYAGWAKMSDGVVSADGASVSTADGPQGGFTFLENFAIRKAP